MNASIAPPPAVGDWVVDTHWAVYGADRHKVGTVRDVLPDYLIVRQGRFVRRERYIPVSTITHIERQCFYLNVSSKDFDDRSWDRLSAVSATVVALDDPSVSPVAGSLAAR